MLDMVVNTSLYLFFIGIPESCFALFRIKEASAPPYTFFIITSLIGKFNLFDMFSEFFMFAPSYSPKLFSLKEDQQ